MPKSDIGRFSSRHGKRVAPVCTNDENRAPKAPKARRVAWSAWAWNWVPGLVNRANKYQPFAGDEVNDALIERLLGDEAAYRHHSSELGRANPGAVDMLRSMTTNPTNRDRLLNALALGFDDDDVLDDADEPCDSATACNFPDLETSRRERSWWRKRMRKEEFLLSTCARHYMSGMTKNLCTFGTAELTSSVLYGAELLNRRHGSRIKVPNRLASNTAHHPSNPISRC